MGFFRFVSPKHLVADTRAFIGNLSREQLIGGVAAILIPLGIVVAFYFDTRTNIMPGEQIIYVESWPADRSDEEIIARQKIDQQAREEAEAERRRQFEELADKLGIEAEDE